MKYANLPNPKMAVMIEDFQKQQQERTSKMKSIMDYTMGFVFFCTGIFFIVYREFGIKKIGNHEPSPLDYVIGVVFVLYGSWRIYRGYKKNYYR